MSSVYDGNLTVSIFGQSHAPAIGVTIDGLPAGLPVDLDALRSVSAPPRARAERLVDAAEGGGPAGVFMRAEGRPDLRRAAHGHHPQHEYALRRL